MQAKLAAVASPNDAFEGEEYDSDGEPEPEGSAERIAFRAVVEEMEDLFFQQSARKSGARPSTYSQQNFASTEQFFCACNCTLPVMSVYPIEYHSQVAAKVWAARRPQCCRFLN